MKQQKKKKGRSVQELLGIRTFTKYGLSTNKGELLERHGLRRFCFICHQFISIP